VTQSVHAGRFRRAEGAAAGVVDGQTVVVAPTDLRYHALNTSGTVVWELLANGTDVSRAVALLMERFEVDETTCRRDVSACLEQFVEIGIAVSE
jgi:hypothetical protein